MLNGKIYYVSNKAKEKINSYINMKVSKYAYVDMQKIISWEKK